MFSVLRDNYYRFMKFHLQTSFRDYFVSHFDLCFHSTWFLSILAEFGRFCWCDFGRIDFWRVKRCQMRLSWKFSLLNRYFSTTLLYQFFFDQTICHIIINYRIMPAGKGLWLIIGRRGGVEAIMADEEGWSGGPVKSGTLPARSGIPTRRTLSPEPRREGRLAAIIP